MKKIYFLVLHLGYGGVEKTVIDQANILSEKYLVEIISFYKLYDKPPYKLNDNIKVKYLSQFLPNKSLILKHLKALKLFSLFIEGLKSIKILLDRTTLMKKEIKKINEGTIISSRILYTKLLNKYGNAKIIKIAEEHRHHNNDRKYIKKLKKACKNIDYLLPVSNELTKDYSKIMSKLHIKCLYIPHFLDFIPDKGSSLNSKEITFIGRLSPEKGCFDLIEIFNELLKKDKDLILNIVGDGVLREDLIEKVDYLKLTSNVIFHGYQNKEYINKVLKETSVYLMTSFSESFGLVLLEAASFGIPLVAFDTAQGANEIIKNDFNGFLIPNRNKKLFSKKVLEIINDSKLSKRLGVNSRTTASFYSKEKVKKQWFDFLEGLEEKNEKIY